MKEFFGDSSTIAKEIVVTEIGVNANNDAQGVARFKLYNSEYDFDIDFTLLTILESTGCDIFQHLTFEEMQSDDRDLLLDDVAITPYSEKAIAQLAALGCSTNGIGKPYYLGSSSFKACLDVMNQETFYNPTFQSGLNKWRDKVGFHFNEY